MKDQNQCRPMAADERQMIWGPVAISIMELEASRASAREHHDEALLAERYEDAKRLKEREKDLVRSLNILHAINSATR